MNAEKVDFPDKKEDEVVVPRPAAAVPAVVPPSPGPRTVSPTVRSPANNGRADSAEVVAAIVPAQAAASSGRTKPPEVQGSGKTAGPAAVSGSKPAGNVGAAKVKAAPAVAVKAAAGPSMKPKPKGVQPDRSRQQAAKKAREALEDLYDEVAEQAASFAQHRLEGVMEKVKEVEWGAGLAGRRWGESDPLEPSAWYQRPSPMRLPPRAPWRPPQVGPLRVSFAEPAARAPPSPDDSDSDADEDKIKETGNRVWGY